MHSDGVHRQVSPWEYPALTSPAASVEEPLLARLPRPLPPARARETGALAAASSCTGGSLGPKRPSAGADAPSFDLAAAPVERLRRRHHSR